MIKEGRGGSKSAHRKVSSGKAFAPAEFDGFSFGSQAEGTSCRGRRLRGGTVNPARALETISWLQNKVRVSSLSLKSNIVHLYISLNERRSHRFCSLCCRSCLR